MANRKVGVSLSESGRAVVMAASPPFPPAPAPSDGCATPSRAPGMERIDPFLFVFFLGGGRVGWVPESDRRNEKHEREEDGEQT